MVSGLVGFEEIVEAVKDETGLETLRSYYERIKRLIFRAEMQIGYGGSIILKKAVYIKGENGFDGTYLKFPPDYIEHEGLGNCSGVFRGCTYTFRPEGIRMVKPQDKVVLLYYGVFCDGQGNPVSTRNHFEAVVAFIVWKLYSSRVYLGLGNFNLKKDYQYTFESALGASRGFDAAPTTEQWTGIGYLTYQWVGELIMFPTAGYNYCDDSIQTACIPLAITDETAVKVYYWQESSSSIFLQDVIDEYTADPEIYFNDKASEFLAVFQQGKIVNYANVGRVGFAIKKTDNLNWQLTDSLNNDITHLFDTYYDNDNQVIIFLSIEYYDYGTQYFKFKILNPVTLPAEEGVYDSAYNDSYN